MTKIIRDKKYNISENTKRALEVPPLTVNPDSASDDDSTNGDDQPFPTIAKIQKLNNDKFIRSGNGTWHKTSKEQKKSEKSQLPVSGKNVILYVKMY